MSPGFSIVIKPVCLVTPVGEVGAIGQGARVFVTGHPFADGHQRGELVAGSGRVPSLSSPPSEVAAGNQGVGMLGAGDPFTDW